MGLRNWNKPSISYQKYEKSDSIMSTFFSSQLFILTLSIGAFVFAQWIQRKTRISLFNPLLVSFLLVLPVLYFCDISATTFVEGSELISFFLVPATACLGLTIYRVWDTVKAQWFPILCGCFVGCLTAIGSTLILCHLFNIPEMITQSLYPKSVTTPIAMAIAESRGGNASLAVAGVAVVGVFGAFSSPFLIKLFRVKNPIAQGVAIGTTCHALGTAAALQIGPMQGAISAVAMSFCAAITVILSMFF